MQCGIYKIPKLAIKPHGNMSKKQVILHKSDIFKIISQTDFCDICDYIVHMREYHGLSPYKKDIRPAEFGNGLGEKKMNHFSIRTKKQISENYRYYVVNKHKWFLSKITHGV